MEDNQILDLQMRSGGQVSEDTCGPRKKIRGDSPAGPSQGARPALTLAAGLVVAMMMCVCFVDRPVASYFWRHQEFRPMFQICAAPSLLTGPGAEVFLAYAAVQRLRGAHRVSRIWLAMSVARLTGTVIKNDLQFLFGRPWPETWLRLGTYHFHPFVDNASYGGFPSGHTTFIAAPMCVLWVMIPRLRLVWGGITGLVMLGLVGADYHFVGDVLAGLLTGMVCAWASLFILL
jgi:membrane-associated phospholipid phosphatase